MAASCEKRTGLDLVLDGSFDCAFIFCFRCLHDALAEIGFKVTG